MCYGWRLSKRTFRGIFKKMAPGDSAPADRALITISIARQKATHAGALGEDRLKFYFDQLPADLRKIAAESP